MITLHEQRATDVGLKSIFEDLVADIPEQS